MPPLTAGIHTVDNRSIAKNGFRAHQLTPFAPFSSPTLQKFNVPAAGLGVES